MTPDERRIEWRHSLERFDVHEQTPALRPRQGAALPSTGGRRGCRRVNIMQVCVNTALVKSNATSSDSRGRRVKI
jgi:hypothetical protein